MSEQPARDVAAMSFEQALAELERIVENLEKGELDLEAAISAYERGTLLRTHCEGKLKDAELKVQKITAGPQGPTLQDSETDDDLRY